MTHHILQNAAAMILISGLFLQNSGSNEGTFHVELSDFTSLGYGGDNNLALKLINSSKDNITILGFGTSCGETCCIVVDKKTPFSIKPDQVYELNLICHIRKSGAYTHTFPIVYQDGKATRTVRLTISGYSSVENRLNKEIK